MRAVAIGKRDAPTLDRQQHFAQPRVGLEIVTVGQGRENGLMPGSKINVIAFSNETP